MVSFRALVLFFLKLGSLGFGGPLALVALMQQECVERKKWISAKRFEETFVFCKMLPGPLAYQMALWVGYELKGKWGGFLSGVAFVFPSALLLYFFAKFYVWVGALKGATTLLAGMRVASLGIILQSVVSLFGPYQRNKASWMFALLGALMMVFFPRWEPIIILLGGALSVGFQGIARNFRIKLSSLGLLLALFWTHFKAGAFVFGTGLAIVPVLQREVVDAFHWISEEEFLDALAFGQITPGPITTLASFIGFKAAGGIGSLVASLGMYTPGVLMILGILPVLRKRIESQAWLVAFQAGAVPAVIGCLAVATFRLISTTVTTPGLAVSFGVLLGVQWLMRIPPWGLIFVGGGLQILIRFFFS